MPQRRKIDGRPKSTVNNAIQCHNPGPIQPCSVTYSDLPNFLARLKRSFQDPAVLDVQESTERIDRRGTTYSDDERFTRYLHESDAVWNLIVRTQLASAECKYTSSAGESTNQEFLKAIDTIVLRQYRMELFRRATGTKGKSPGGSQAWGLVLGDLTKGTEEEEASALSTICGKARCAPDRTEDVSGPGTSAIGGQEPEGPPAMAVALYNCNAPLPIDAVQNEKSAGREVEQEDKENVINKEADPSTFEKVDLEAGLGPLIVLQLSRQAGWGDVISFAKLTNDDKEKLSKQLSASLSAVANVELVREQLQATPVGRLSDGFLRFASSLLFGRQIRGYRLLVHERPPLVRKGAKAKSYAYACPVCVSFDPEKRFFSGDVKAILDNSFGRHWKILHKTNFGPLAAPPPGWNFIGWCQKVNYDMLSRIKGA